MVSKYDRGTELAGRLGRAISAFDVVAVLTALAVGIGLRVAWAIRSEAEPASDGEWYHVVAQSIVSGDGIATLSDPVIPTALFPPGYPIVLAEAYKLWRRSMGGPDREHGRRGQHDRADVRDRTDGLFETGRGDGRAHPCDLPQPGAVHAVGHVGAAVHVLLHGRRRVAAPVHASDAQTNTDADGGSRFRRRRGNVGARAGAGAGTPRSDLVVAAAQTAGSSLAAYSSSPVALFVFAVAITILPWTMRNWIQLGSPVPLSTNVGWNAVIGHNQFADGGYMSPGNYFLDTLDYPEPQRGVKIYENGVRLAWSYARSHPRHELELSVKKAYLLWKDDDEAVLWQELARPPYLGDGERRLLTDASNYFYFAVLALALLGWTGSDARNRGWRWLIVLLALGWTAFHMLSFAEGRFHYPLSPLLSVSAAAGLVAIARTLRRIAGRSPAAR